MSCTSPLYRVPVSTKNFALLTPSDQKRLKNHCVFLRYHELKSYESMSSWNSDQVQIIPCGQCLSCRLAYSKDWAIRCMLEAQDHEFNYFVTLTYDDFHLPSGEFVDYDGIVWESDLRRRDVQLFMKNLREFERTENNNTGIKVFYCGEYGDENGRPHYHLCLFGVSEIKDLIYHFTSGKYKHYQSKLYESFWTSKETGIKVPRGFVDITNLSFDTVAYTARYVVKKQKGKKKGDFLEFYNSLDCITPVRTQPFVGMSLKPGIASAYFERNKLQIATEDAVKYQNNYELFSSRCPRYFDKLFDRDDPVSFSKIKAKRLKNALAARSTKSLLYSESEFSRFERENKILIDKTNRYYKRNL